MHATLTHRTDRADRLVALADAIQQSIARAFIRLGDTDESDAVPHLQAARTHAMTLAAVASELVREIDARSR